MLETAFKLRDSGTTVRTEVLAGITTFLTMVYIVFVNPSILQAAGMDQGAVFVATCLAAALGTAIMGLYANYPIALAPGMGLNAYFTYGVVLGMGHSWQVALGAVFLSGILFIILSVLPVREWIVNSIPRSLKMAISAGIGLFLAIIGLKNAGIVVDHPATLVTLGDITAAPALLAALGFLLMAALNARRVPGAIVIAILVVTGIGVALDVSPTGGIFSMPPSIAPTFLAMDIWGALEVGLITIVFAFLFVDLFDTAGTLVGLAHRGRLLDERGRLPRLRQALLAGQRGDGRRRDHGHVDDDQLHRECRRYQRRRPHRADRRYCGDTVRAVPVSFAAGEHHSGVRDGAGPALCRLPDGPRPRRDRLGRRHRGRPGRDHRRQHAANLFYRHRNRPRLHQLRGDQDSRRTRVGSRCGGDGSICRVHRQIRNNLMFSAKNR